MATARSSGGGSGRSRGASRQLRAGDAADPKTDAPARRSGDEPDVLLDVPKLTVEEISLEVDNLHAQIALEARLADLVQLRVGADVESSGSRSRSRVSRRRRSSRPGSTTCLRSSSGRSTRSTTIPGSSPSLPAALNAPRVASVRAWRRSGEEGGQLVEGTVEEAGPLAEGTGAFRGFEPDSDPPPFAPEWRLRRPEDDLVSCAAPSASCPASSIGEKTPVGGSRAASRGGRGGLRRRSSHTSCSQLNGALDDRGLFSPEPTGRRELC
jgi:hypothetical protein